MAFTPPWQAPDEPRHFQYVRLMLDLGRIPLAEDVRAAVQLQGEVYRSLQSQRYWQIRDRQPNPAGDENEVYAVEQAIRGRGLVAAVGQPPLYYGLAALLLWPFRSASILSQLYILRSLSVLLSVGAVWATFLAAGWLSPADPAGRWPPALFVALLPMHGFMSAVANNDALADFASATTFAALAWVCFRGWSTGRGLLLGVPLMVALCTKRTTAFLVPLLLVSLVLMAWPRLVTRRSGFVVGRRAISRVVLLAVLGAVLAAIGFSVLMLKPPVVAHWLGQISAAEGRPLSAMSAAYSAPPLERYGLFTLLGFASFWANFGWMNVPLDVGWYALLAAMTLIAGLGWLRFGARIRAGDRPLSTFWAICSLAVTLVVLQTGASMVLRNQPPQGRYLFPGIAPIGICFVTGLLEWIPPQHRSLARAVFVAWWGIFNLIGVLGYALPAFYG
jgi:hypothetical protein